MICASLSLQAEFYLEQVLTSKQNFCQELKTIYIHWYLYKKYNVIKLNRIMVILFYWMNFKTAIFIISCPSKLLMTIYCSSNYKNLKNILEPRMESSGSSTRLTISPQHTKNCLSSSVHCPLDLALL